MDEQERLWVTQAKAGDQESLGNILERHRASVYSRALRNTSGRINDANDLVSETFVRALRGLTNFEIRPDKDFLAWLYVILSNVTYDWRKKNQQVITCLEDDLKARTEKSDYKELVEEVAALPDSGADLPVFKACVELWAAGRATSLDDLATALRMDKEKISNHLYRARKTDAFNSMLPRVVSRRGALGAAGGIACTLAFGEAVEAHTPTPSFDASMLEGIRTPSQLIELLGRFGYRFATQSSLRSALTRMRNPSQVIESALSAVQEVFWTNPALAGSLGDLFFKYGHSSPVPDRETLRRLEYLCEYTLKSDQLELYGSIEPLVNSLESFGKPEMHQRFLQRTLDAVPWREAHAKLVAKYYGDARSQLKAVERHLRDPRRKGLHRVHDLPLLVNLVGSQELGATMRADAKRLLSTMAIILRRESQHEMLATLRPFIEGA